MKHETDIVGLLLLIVLALLLFGFLVLSNLGDSAYLDPRVAQKDFASGLTKSILRTEYVCGDTTTTIMDTLSCRGVICTCRDDEILHILTHASAITGRGMQLEIESASALDILFTRKCTGRDTFSVWIDSTNIRMTLC